MSAPAMSRTILVVNGPNLNLLGEREPHIYGNTTLAQIEQLLAERAYTSGYQVQCVQSNHEGALIDAIQKGRHASCGLIINPGGYAHTSVALRDALTAYAHPKVEVHLSNVYQREAFRHHSYLSPVVQGVICGLGYTGYLYALDYLVQTLNQD